MLIGDTLAHNGKHNPGGDALVFGNQRLTWGELNGGANRFANALLGQGAGPGDRALMILNNSVEFIEVYYGLAKIGCISAPVMPSSVPSEIAYVANDLGAKYIIVEAAAAHLLDEIGDQLETVQCIIGVGDGHGREFDYKTLLAEASPEEPDVTIDPDDDLTIKYTSGTTGAPKGCVRTHRNFIMAALIYLNEQPLVEDDLASITSPLAAGMAISELSRYVLRGVPFVMMPKFDAKEYLGLIERERITVGYAMESLLKRLAEYPDLNNYDLSSLRSFSGNRLEVIQPLLAQKTFSAGLHGGYGSSEAGGRISFLKPDDFRLALDNPAYAERLSSLGRAGMLYRIEAMDVDMRPVPAGEIGDLAISGPSVFKGYWQRPEETAETLRDGWLMTGDLARIDEDGYIFLAGRKRDMIKTGGINVYPAEIEPVLMSHDKITNAAVVGIADDEWGEKVVACVVAAGDCSEAELIDYCRDKLAGYKIPKSVHFMDELPINETGKIVKKDLRRMLSGDA
ncbi:MAG: AMP-binding protein [Rhodospirillales bacterium]|nr:AMP-binding protein [Rhodospirillales bacterium]